jgi:phage FluMu protein Com
MPVRFRCKHCDQLLGIARRKIGTEVRCPECQKMVLVPAENAQELDEPTRKGDPPSEGDRPPGRFHQVADPSVEPPEAKNDPLFSRGVRAPAFDDEPYRLPVHVQTAGFVLSPLHASLLTIGALFVLALAFALGLLIGRYFL